MSSSEITLSLSQEQPQRRRLFTLPPRIQVANDPSTRCIKIPNDIVVPERPPDHTFKATPIIGNSLFLGDYNDAQNVVGLKDVGITHIVSCCPELQTSIPTVEGIVYHRICLPDRMDAKIFDHFGQVYDFIVSAFETNEKAKVLVHCAAGVSRSASLVISFLMKYFSIDFDTALAIVCDLRTKVWPNLGFQYQLRDFEKTLFLS
jgi:atypical dual specificity phosphatase